MDDWYVIGWMISGWVDARCMYDGFIHASSIHLPITHPRMSKWKTLGVWIMDSSAYHPLYQSVIHHSFTHPSVHPSIRPSRHPLIHSSFISNHISAHIQSSFTTKTYWILKTYLHNHHLCLTVIYGAR